MVRNSKLRISSKKSFMYSCELDLITHLKNSPGECVILQILFCLSIDKSGWGDLTTVASLVARPLRFVPFRLFAF